MGVKENIHMSALYAAADILCRVNGSVNHQFASDGDNPGIHSHRMPGRGDAPELVWRPHPSEQERQGQ